MNDFPGRLAESLANRYRIERELGAGGMATVYLAEDLRHHRQVAIKVLRTDVALALGAERFLREVGTAARLTHPNIVPIFDSGEVQIDDGPLPFYVMPYVPGETLRERLRRERQLPVDQALRIARDIGSALTFAHGQGVIHRDVKPENILLEGDSALLADFGIARAVSAAGSECLTATGMVVGTPAYMSPEQAAGDAAVDARSDVYSLATVVYEMLGGEAPFSGATPQAVLARQLSGEVRPLHTIRPSLPVSLDRALKLALAPAAADRPGTIAAFVSELERDLQPGRAGFRWTGWRRVAAIAAGMVVLGVGVTLLRGRLGPGPATSSDGRLGIAMMPFRAEGETGHWAEAMPDLISVFLDGTPGLWVADPWSLWRPLRPDHGAPARSPDPSEAARLTDRAGARRFVLGRVVKAGPVLQLTLRVYGVGMMEPLSSFEMEGHGDSLPALAERAAVGVLSRVWEGEGGPSVPRLEGTLTQSPEALKAYLAAREATRRGLPDSAQVAIDRALALDSTFALALLEAAHIRSWSQFLRGAPYQGLRQLLARAMAFRDSLPLRYRLRLEASAANIETDGRAAAAAYQQLLAHDSADVEALNGLAYSHLAYGWQYGITERDMLEVAERAVRADSTYAPALFRRAQLTTVTRDPADAEAQLQRLRGADSGSVLLRAARVGLEVLVADDEEFARRAPDLVRLPPVEFGSVFRRLRAFRPDRVLALVRLGGSGTSGPPSPIIAGAEAQLLAGVGRIAEVDSLRTAGRYTGIPVIEAYLTRSVVANALLGIEAPGLTARALARLASQVTPDSSVTRFDQVNGWLGGWLQGAYHASLGDTATGRRWAEFIGRLPEGGSPRSWPRAEANDLGSRLAGRQGLADSAGRLAREAYALWTVHTENTLDDQPEPILRFRLAELLRSAGQRDSADALFRSLVPPTTWLGGLTARSLLALGELAEERGDRETAARHFDHALQFWELGGPEVAEWRRRAEEGLRRTASGTVFRYGVARSGR